MAIHHCPRCRSLRIVTAVVGGGRRGLCLACHTRWFEDRGDSKKQGSNGQASARPKSHPKP